jgi:ketosteroid isomerase-like protein
MATVSPAALELVTMEFRFCQWAKYRGIKEAFLAHLSEDAVLFKPRPTNGREWFLRNPDMPGLLTWQPSYVEVSPSNDLGYTTGPWVYTITGEPLSHGHYVTFWQKVSDLGWMAVLDVGTVHPPLETGAGMISFQQNGSHVRGRPTTRSRQRRLRDRLLTLDRSYAGKAERLGFAAAARAVWSEDIRFYRMGEAPKVGKKRAMGVARTTVGVMALTPVDCVVSTECDLGFTYGASEFRTYDLRTKEQGSYLRAWRKNGAGDWHVVLDLVVSIPAESSGTD